MLFVDSSVWIDFLNGKSTHASRRLQEEIPKQRIAIGDLVMAEVLQGYGPDRDFETARYLLSKFHPVAVVGHEIAVQAAANYRTLRARGITVRKTIDTLIATRCIVEGWALLYGDRDFDPFVAHLGLRSALA